MSEQPELPSDQNVLDMFFEIGAAERHFNDLQSTYRKLASLWLLSSFYAIGYIFTNASNMPLSPYLIGAIVALFGMVGLLLLWNMDLLVYHRLLDSYFLEGLVLERKYSFLPPIRHGMMQSQDGTGKGVLVRVIMFYVAPINILLFVGIFLISIFFYERADFCLEPQILWPVAIATVFVTVLFCWLISYQMRRQTMNIKMFESRLSSLPPPEGYDR